MARCSAGVPSSAPDGLGGVGPPTVRAVLSRVSRPEMVRLVLVVDDNASFRELAARVLTSWGYGVIQAGTVDEALVRARLDHPDTALVDIGLPDGDGFELTRQLVGLPGDMRVVIVSTDADAGNGSVARQAGACGFFPKDELLETRVRKLIGGDAPTGG